MNVKQAAFVGAGCALAAVTASMLLSSCSQKAQEPFRDAGTSGHDSGKALVIEMPDGFSNLATKCVNGIRYTVTYHGDHAYGAVSVTGGPNNGC